MPGTNARGAGPVRTCDRAGKSEDEIAYHRDVRDGPLRACVQAHGNGDQGKWNHSSLPSGRTSPLSQDATTCR